MKYIRLTKEQLEELHSEFINFLATQSITSDEWTKIKSERPEAAEQELDVFSDLIWEGVLNTVSYLENISPQQLFLFKTGEIDMQLTVVKVSNTAHDLTTPEGFKWLQENFTSNEVEFQRARKVYEKERNVEIFDLLRQGSNITKGELFDFFEKILN